MAEPNDRDDRTGSGGRVTNFVLGKGFYIVLFLCIAAIGISGYVIIRNATIPTVEPTPMSGISLPDLGLASTALTPPTTSTAPRTPATLAPATVPSASSVDAAVTTDIPAASSVTTAPTASQTTTTPAKVFYVAPVVGQITRGFSGATPVYNPTMDDWRVHTGIDIAAEVGEAVCAVTAGTVTDLREDYFEGVVLELTHADGRVSVYSGLAESPYVSVGETVVAGTVIGQIGETAIFESLDGAHLHFSMMENGAYVDPVQFLPGKAE